MFKSINDKALSKKQRLERASSYLCIGQYEKDGVFVDLTERIPLDEVHLLTIFGYGPKQVHDERRNQFTESLKQWASTLSPNKDYKLNLTVILKKE